MHHIVILDEHVSVLYKGFSLLNVMKRQAYAQPKQQARGVACCSSSEASPPEVLRVMDRCSPPQASTEQHPNPPSSLIANHTPRLHAASPYQHS